MEVFKGVKGVYIPCGKCFGGPRVKVWTNSWFILFYFTNFAMCGRPKYFGVVRSCYVWSGIMRLIIVHVNPS